MLSATPAVNYHLFKPCDAACHFCFATFRDVDGHLSLDEAQRLITLLREAGAEKLNFAGGEPTLHPHIGALLHRQPSLGSNCIAATRRRQPGSDILLHATRAPEALQDAKGQPQASPCTSNRHPSQSPTPRLPGPPPWLPPT